MIVSTVNQLVSELESRIYIFMDNGKIISLANLFQRLYICRSLSEWKIKFILSYLVRISKSMQGTN